VGDPRDEIVMSIAGLIGVSAALYYWNRTRARELAEQVATEMSRVTWPSRTEVTNGTFVVIVTTVVSTVFFALMDKFWGFVTNLVYGGT
jgi:preprotein translocase subunit SecE